MKRNKILLGIFIVLAIFSFMSTEAGMNFKKSLKTVIGDFLVTGNAVITGSLTSASVETGSSDVSGDLTVGEGIYSKTVTSTVDGNGSTNTNQGILVSNTTDSTSGTKKQYPPFIGMMGSNWTGSESKDILTYFSHTSYNDLATQVSIGFNAKYGTASDIVHPFKVLFGTSASASSVNFSLYGLNESASYALSLDNNAPATAGVDQFAPGMLWRSYGWATSVGTSMRNALGAYYRMDQGTLSPTGTLSFCGKINDYEPTITNELLGICIGSDSRTTGVKFNRLGTFSDYTVDMSNASIVKPKIYSQATEPDIANDSNAFWTDTDDGKYYLILDIGGTQKKIELT